MDRMISNSKMVIVIGLSQRKISNHQRVNHLAEQETGEVAARMIEVYRLVIRCQRNAKAAHDITPGKSSRKTMMALSILSLMMVIVTGLFQSEISSHQIENHI